MDKYYIFYSFLGWQGTTEDNYKAVHQNARKINKFYDFDNIQDIINYVHRYFKYDLNNIIVVSDNIN